jgi:murein DD-endopeptidase MepM/ murein hydrolase activator NlpD
LAAAAALGVLAGGAAFLAYAMSRPTDSRPFRSAEAFETAAPTNLSHTDDLPLRGEIGLPTAALGASTNDALIEAADDGAPEPRAAPVHKEQRDAGKSGKSPDAPPRAAMTIAENWLADESDRPPPFYFENDLDRGEFGPSLVTSFDGDLSLTPTDVRTSLARGENFVDLLRRVGVRAEDRNGAAYAFGKAYNLRQLRPAQEFALTIAEPNRTLFQSVSEAAPPPAHLLSMEFRADAETRIILARSAKGEFEAKKITAPLATRIANISGRIEGSLYLSAKNKGAPDDVIASLAQMFAYDVDFQREIFGGDEFEAVFEVKYDDAGKIVGGGEVLFGRLKWRGRQKEKGYYRFASADNGGKADYYDAAGESARRLLMKTPIDGARLSSGFGTRKHPILGYEKAHKGVDFAAARGTPIMAAGDGVVERAGPYGSFGNYVRIRHAQGYKTAYAHMNAIKKGVRTGVRVRQGDVIGYVGTTGRSTGPHLHYEVHLKDVPVNPQSLKIATGVALSGKDLQRFNVTRDQIDAMRLTGAVADKASLVADAKSKKDSL